MITSRRRFLAGLGGILAIGMAPAIVHTPGLLMPVKPALILPASYDIDAGLTEGDFVGMREVGGQMQMGYLEGGRIVWHEGVA